MLEMGCNAAVESSNYLCGFGTQKKALVPGVGVALLPGLSWLGTALKVQVRWFNATPDYGCSCFGRKPSSNTKCEEAHAPSGAPFDGLRLLSGEAVADDSWRQRTVPESTLLRLIARMAVRLARI
jgi:hypothetical protein